jgi:predicted Zn-dependent protease
MKRSMTILLVATMMIALVVLVYFKKSQTNPLTGARQYVDLSPDEEVILGIQSAPQLASQFGGLFENKLLRDSVKNVGDRLVKMSSFDLHPYKFDFHLLADQKNRRALSLPGGQVFITAGLLNQIRSADQLAGVLSHEMGHVVGRHAAERLAAKGLFHGLVGAGRSESGKDPDAKMKTYVSDLISMDFNESDETDCDGFALRFMADAGYNPEALLGNLEILNSKSVSFNKNHPKGESRLIKLDQAIRKYLNR